MAVTEKRADSEEMDDVKLDDDVDLITAHDYVDIMSVDDDEEDATYRMHSQTQRSRPEQSQFDRFWYSAQEFAGAIQTGDCRRGLEVAREVTSSMVDTTRTMIRNGLEGVSQKLELNVPAPAVQEPRQPAASHHRRAVQPRADNEAPQMEWEGWTSLPHPPAMVTDGPTRRRVTLDSPQAQVRTKLHAVQPRPRGRRLRSCPIDGPLRDTSPEFLPPSYYQFRSAYRARLEGRAEAEEERRSRKFRETSQVQNQPRRMRPSDDDEYSNVRRFEGFSKESLRRESSRSRSALLSRGKPDWVLAVDEEVRRSKESSEHMAG